MTLSVPAEALLVALSASVKMAMMEMATHAEVHCLPHQCVMQCLTNVNSPIYLQIPMSVQQAWMTVIPMQTASTSPAHTHAIANQDLKEMDNYA